MLGLFSNRTRDTLVLLTAVGASLTVGARAWSQTAQTTPQSGEAGLTEITVTATRRETKLSDTPISMSALTADKIDKQRIVSFSDVQLSVPNFTFTEITRQETFFSIRGTGINNDTPGSDTGVSVFIDGVPRTGVHDTNPDMFDLQGIEVLRGPQGTLFGRNTTGGAVIIHTVKPSFDPLFKGQLTYGNRNLVEVNGLATGPIIPGTLAGKFSFLLHHKDGNVDNVFQNRENGREKAGSMRGQLLWVPSDSVKVLFAADYQRDLSESRLGLLESTFSPSLFPNLQFGPDVTNSAYTPVGSNTIAGFATTVDWSMDVGTVTSITGYRSVTSALTYAPLGDPQTQLFSDQQVKDRQYSEELHFASATGQRLTWLGGLFYLHLNRLDNDLYTLNLVPGTTNFIGLGAPPGFQSARDMDVLTTSRAIFGEVTYAVLDDLNLTLGGRYSSERRSGHSEYTPFAASGPYEHSWNSFTPKGTLSFKPTADVLTYATVAKGFTSGGFDGGANTPELMRTPFNPETVINYELGAKITAFDRRFTVDSAVFLADYKDLQRTAFDASPSVNSYRTTNAGKARVKGIETEFTYLPVNWLTLGLNYAYTDARYREYNYAPGLSYAGNVLPQTPKQQVHASAEVNVPWSAVHGELFAGSDYTFRSQIQFEDSNNTPQSILDKTRFNGIVNLHVGWRSTDERMTVNLFAKNVSNRRALINFPDFTDYFATPNESANPNDHIYLARYTPERALGVSLTVRY
jgi:iron complex outermembrane recepter protein